MASNRRRRTPPGRIAIDFIDPLFAVVISISFVRIMDIREFWFGGESATSRFSAQSAFEIATLLIGYSTIILSWVGYHASIMHSQIRIDTRPGFFRFILDIVLLTGYWLLLVKFESLLTVLGILVSTYFIFILWDQLKWLEYRRRDSIASRRRRGVTTFWFLVFLFVVFLPYFFITGANDTLDKNDWLFLALAHLFTVLYRVHKEFLHPSWLLDLLAFRLPTSKKE
ncbi:MAG: hypothetical protein MN733_44260 [Nitrososphaera sp.]|nr:hypothetical protein [Nitrososphaera sp.]